MGGTVAKILFTVSVATVLLAILPLSPFESVIDTLASTPYLGYLNFFFPIGKCLSLCVAWSSAILTFYGVQWALRQLGIIS